MLKVGRQLQSKLTFLRSVLMSYPEMMAVPLEGEISPVSILKVVVLPAPESMNILNECTYVYVHLYMHMSYDIIYLA